MLGAIIGDMVGSPYEFHPWQGAAEAFPLFSPCSRFTDDTVMTVAVARGLMQAYGQEQACREAFIDAMHEWAGYGQRFFRWIVTGISLRRYWQQFARVLAAEWRKSRRDFSRLVC